MFTWPQGQLLMDCFSQAFPLAKGTIVPLPLSPCLVATEASQEGTYILGEVGSPTVVSTKKNKFLLLRKMNKTT